MREIEKVAQWLGLASPVSTVLDVDIQSALLLGNSSQWCQLSLSAILDSTAEADLQRQNDK